jgi:hypothetical protein
MWGKETETLLASHEGNRSRLRGFLKFCFLQNTHTHTHTKPTLMEASLELPNRPMVIKFQITLFTHFHCLPCHLFYIEVNFI